MMIIYICLYIRLFLLILHIFDIEFEVLPFS